MKYIDNNKGYIGIDTSGDAFSPKEQHSSQVKDEDRDSKYDQEQVASQIEPNYDTWLCLLLQYLHHDS